MGKAMIASKMTDGQVENFVDKFRAALRKHRADISSETAQQVLGVENIGMKLFSVVRKYSEYFSEMIVRRVKVNRDRTPQEMLDAIGWKKYFDKQVVPTMPRGEGDDVEVIFFNVGHHITDAELDQEYELRGLKPADPYSVAAVNEADPEFSDTRPNCTHWKDANDKWCYVVFDRVDDGHEVHVEQNNSYWDDYWWFAGLRK